MEKKTLNSFIDQQILRFSLPNTAETRRKIRVKLLRTITQPKPNSYFKDNNVWEKAETTTVNGAKTKLLNADDLTHLAEETQSYFENLSIKTGGLSKKEFEDLKKEHAQNYANALADRETYDYTQDDKATLERMYDRYAQKVMLKAIFEKFYTPLDKEKIEKDLGQIYYQGEPLEFVTDPATLAANNRLNNPEKNYFTKKD